MSLFDVIRRPGSPPWDPEDLPSLPQTLPLVNEHLAHHGLRLIRVEPSFAEDTRTAYVLVRLDGREISPARIFSQPGQAAEFLFPHGI